VHRSATDHHSENGAFSGDPYLVLLEVIDAPSEQPRRDEIQDAGGSDQEDLKGSPVRSSTRLSNSISWVMLFFLGGINSLVD
jgi:hypothetical protein